MAAALELQQRGVRRKIFSGGLGLFPIQNAILRAHKGEHVQAAFGQIRRGIGGKQNQSPVGARVFCCIRGGHNAAQRVAGQIPVGHSGIQRLQSVSGVRGQNRKIARHAHEDTQHAALGAGLHQGGICLILHLAAGIEDEPGNRILGGKHQSVPVKAGHSHGLCRLPDRLERLGQRAVISGKVDPAAHDQTQHKRRQNPTHAAHPPRPG